MHYPAKESLKLHKCCISILVLVLKLQLPILQPRGGKSQPKLFIQPAIFVSLGLGDKWFTRLCTQIKGQVRS